MYKKKSIKHFLWRGIQNPSRRTRFVLLLLFYVYVHIVYISGAPLQPFMMFDRPEVILIFSIAQECLCAYEITRDSVPCLSNCIITAARTARVLLYYYCYNNISQSPKAGQKFVALYTQLQWARIPSDHRSSDGQRMASVINVFSDVLLITRHKGHYCIRVSWHL